MHHLGLVGNQIELDVRRKTCLNACQLGVQVFAEIVDIVAFVHLNRKQNGGLAIHAHVVIRILVRPVNVCQIPDVDRLACCARDIHHDLPDVVLCVKPIARLNWDFVVAVRNAASILDGVASLESLHYLERSDPVLGKLRIRGVHLNGFRLVANAMDLRNHGKGANAVLNRPGIVC